MMSKPPSNYNSMHLDVQRHSVSKTVPVHVEDPYYHAALATKSCKVDEDPINTKAGIQREKPNPEE